MAVKKDELKWTVGSEVSILGYFHHSIPYQKIPNLSQCLNQVLSMAWKKR